MAKILVVDDEESLRKLLKNSLERKGHEVMAIEDGFVALEVYPKFEPEVVISDIKMPRMGGFKLLETLEEKYDRVVPFIFVTGHGEKAAAIQSLRTGAFDYLEKPFNMDEIHHILDNAIEKNKIIIENLNLTDKLTEANSKLENQLVAKTELVRRIQDPKKSDEAKLVGLDILGNAKAMQPIKNAINRISSSPLGATMSVLIGGPSGSGKEVVAKIVHDLSPRKDGPWVAVNCGALPEGLIESELFGHEKGSFTGASARKTGVFEMADGGTLFLDEIGELPLHLQAKLLRAIQERKFRRVGGSEEISVDIRIIAASNQNLKDEVENKRFREDLFYRLNSLPISIPALKDRGSDEIIRLANYLLEEVTSESGTGPTSFSNEACELLISHSWPGNVRELKSIVGRSALLSESSEVSKDALDIALGNQKVTNLHSGAHPINQNVNQNIDFGGQSYHDWKKKIVEQMEQNYLVALLDKYNGNVSAMSRFMKVTRPNLCRLLKKNGLNAESFRQGSSNEDDRAA